MNASCVVIILELVQLSQQVRSVPEEHTVEILTQPAIHSRINDLLNSELLRESATWKKQHPSGNYYKPNFPVIKADDRVALDEICQMISDQIADAFERNLGQLQQAFRQNTLASGGWEFLDVAQFCYASARRGARRTLERRGILPPRKKHTNGAEWIFWAEEPTSKAKNKGGNAILNERLWLSLRKLVQRCRVSWRSI